MFDFHNDKRLMQATPTGGAPSPDAVTDGGFNEALRKAKTSAEANEIIRNRKRYETGTDVAASAAKTTATTGLEAQAGAVKSTTDNIVDNGKRAASLSQENDQKRLIEILGLFSQSSKNLQANENSIESMKASFSGMVQVLGIVAKHIGFDEFGQSCLDLAKELRPDYVSPSGEGLKELYDLANKLGLDPAKTRQIIEGELGHAAGAAAGAQGDLERARDRAVDSTRNAPYVGPADGAPAVRPDNGSIGAAGFESIVSRYMTGTDKIMAPEALILSKHFPALAAQDGDKSMIDGAERLALKQDIISNVKNQAAETKLLNALGLNGPAPAP